MTDDSTFSLVILAAGLGSRFGGNKPLAGFGEHNITLLELNIFNAYQASCRHAVLIIAPGAQSIFDQHFANKLPSDLTIEYAEQLADDLPNNQALTGRKKPLGTAHALWSCRHLIKNGFVVTNGDDYYGANAFIAAKRHFAQPVKQWAIVAYNVGNTLSNFGGVNRGLCQLTNENSLASITECYSVEQQSKVIQGEIDGNNITLESSQLVSMNFWCLTPTVFDALTQFITQFIETATDNDECQLPDVIEQALSQQKIAVYRSDSQWFGLTYAADKQWVANQLDNLPTQEAAFYQQRG